MKEKMILSKEEMIKWLSAQDYSKMYAITFTMKQRAGAEELNELEAAKNMRLFLNSLNQKVYGNAFRRYGKRLYVIPFLEKSAWQRFHYHISLEKPDRYDEDDFKALIYDCWLKTKFGHKEIHLQQVYSTRWISYCLKNFDEAKSLDIENLHIGC